MFGNPVKFYKYAMKSYDCVFNEILDFIKLNDINSLRKYIDNNPYCIDVTDENKNNILMYAIEFSDMNIINFLIKNYVDIDQANIYGVTPLIKAIIENNTRLVELLLRKEAYVDSVDLEGNSGLFFACMETNLDIINILIRYNADISLKDKLNKYCFEYIPKKKNEQLYLNPESILEFLKLFLFKTRLTTKKENELMELISFLEEISINPLIAAVKNNEPINIIKKLLESGSDKNTTDDEGRTPLIWATINNNYEIVKLLLLYYKVDTSIESVLGFNALDIACSRWHSDIIKLLLEYNFGPSEKNESCMYRNDKYYELYDTDDDNLYPCNKCLKAVSLEELNELKCKKCYDYYLNNLNYNLDRKYINKLRNHHQKLKKSELERE